MTILKQCIHVYELGVAQMVHIRHGQSKESSIRSERNLTDTRLFSLGDVMSNFSSHTFLLCNEDPRHRVRVMPYFDSFVMEKHEKSFASFGLKG